MTLKISARTSAEEDNEYEQLVDRFIELLLPNMFFIAKCSLPFCSDKQYYMLITEKSRKRQEKAICTGIPEQCRGRGFTFVCAN
jgi:hypothetical protein